MQISATWLVEDYVNTPIEDMCKLLQVDSGSNTTTVQDVKLIHHYFPYKKSVRRSLWEAGKTEHKYLGEGFILIQTSDDNKAIYMRCVHAPILPTNVISLGDFLYSNSKSFTGYKIDHNVETDHGIIMFVG